MTHPLTSWNLSAAAADLCPNIQTVGTNRTTLAAIATSGLAASSNARTTGRSGIVNATT